MRTVREKLGSALTLFTSLSVHSAPPATWASLNPLDVSCLPKSDSIQPTKVPAPPSTSQLILLTTLVGLGLAFHWLPRVAPSRVEVELLWGEFWPRRHTRQKGCLFLTSLTNHQAHAGFLKNLSRRQLSWWSCGQISNIPLCICFSSLPASLLFSPHSCYPGIAQPFH